MNIPMWLVVLWFLLFSFSIRTLFVSAPAQMPDIPNVHEVKEGICRIAYIIGILLILINALYAICATIVVGNNIIFTVLTAVMLTSCVTTGLKLHDFIEQFFYEGKVPKVSKIDFYVICKFIHFIYFGVYIFFK